MKKMHARTEATLIEVENFFPNEAIFTSQELAKKRSISVSAATNFCAKMLRKGIFRSLDTWPIQYQKRKG